MYKKSIATFLMFLFLLFIMAPTIIVAIDDKIDVTLLYGCNEEEENEQNISFELVSSNSSNYTTSLFNKNNLLSIGYCFKTYPKPNLNLISPPPEFI